VTRKISLDLKLFYYRVKPFSVHRVLIVQLSALSAYTTSY